MNAAVAINHVGLTVGDLEAGIAFYRDALGFELIAGPLPIVPSDSHLGRLAAEIYGARLTRGRFAHLTAGNDVGLELFEFDDPEAGPRARMEYWKNGCHHICITSANVEAQLMRIEAAGGRRTTAVWTPLPDSGYQLAYAEDPFGNPIEIYNVVYRKMWSIPGTAC